MGLLANAADFEQGGLYSESYQEWVWMQKRHAAVRGRFSPAGQKLVVFGSGPGFLVRALNIAGYDAWGIDAAQYAIDRAQALLEPEYAAKILLADVLDEASLDDARRAAGIRGQRSWDLGISEDLLTCLSDAELAIALPLMRGQVQTNLLHICTVTDPPGRPDLSRTDINWKTAAQWEALVSPPDVFMRADEAAESV